MKILGNIIWVLFGGFFIALEYFVSSIGLFTFRNTNPKTRSAGPLAFRQPSGRHPAK